MRGLSNTSEHIIHLQYVAGTTEIQGRQIPNVRTVTLKPGKNELPGEVVELLRKEKGNAPFFDRDVVDIDDKLAIRTEQELAAEREAAKNAKQVKEKVL